MAKLPAPLATFLRGWNRHDVDAVVRLYGQDAEMHDPTLPEPIHGTAALRAYYGSMWASLPDARLACSGAEADDRGVAWLWRFSAADWQVIGCSYFGLDGGRIVSDHALWDPAGSR